MFPIVLNPEYVRFILVGNQYLAQKRLAQLKSCGVHHIDVFIPGQPCHCLQETVGSDAHYRLPTREELKTAQVVYIVDIEESDAEVLARQCRQLGVLVNVEDVIPLCDFHSASQVRRGDLLMTISTGGKSPGLARRLRKFLSRKFGPEWEDRLNTLGEIRQQWRAQGMKLKQVAQKTDEFIDEKGWLD